VASWFVLRTVGTINRHCYSLIKIVFLSSMLFAIYFEFYLEFSLRKIIYYFWIFFVFFANMLLLQYRVHKYSNFLKKKIFFWLAGTKQFLNFFSTGVHVEILLNICLSKHWAFLIKISEDMFSSVYSTFQKKRLVHLFKFYVSLIEIIMFSWNKN
jgi:hypothetical protein